MTRLLIASGGLLLLICASALLAGRPSEERAWAAQAVQAQPTPQRDPDLKPGFPVDGDGVGRAGIGGPRNNVLVGDVDGKPGLEIVLPPYAWHADGSRVAGWPLTNVAAGGAQALGRLSPASKGLDVVSTSPIVTDANDITVFLDAFAAYSGSAGTILPGWPQVLPNNLFNPPATADLDGDSVDEIFIDVHNEHNLRCYGADGTLLAGWPGVTWPAIADLDGDGAPEVIGISGVGTAGPVTAYHRDGKLVAGFPVTPPGFYFSSYPVVGDVDADGLPDIVLAGNNLDGITLITVLSGSGDIKRTFAVADTGASGPGTALALADLNGDKTPEIIVQTQNALIAVEGDSSIVPGWPQTWTGREVGNSAPVVGDVDGDGFPDIVVTTVLQGQVESEVRAYDRHGQSLPHFPKTVPLGVTYMPALADLEGDGSTDIILAGGDGVWAYDLHGPGPYGPVLWGQFGGGPAHRNSYPLPGPAKAVPTPLPTLTPTVTATPQPPTPTATAVPQQLAANRSGLFRSVLVRSAWNLLLPFFWPFLFMSAFALAYNGYTGWLAVKPQVILRAAGLWLATCAGGGAALMAGLIAGLYAYGVTGNLLGSPAPNLVASLTTPQGRGQMLALVLVGGLIACMVGALAGGLQWLLFQGSYSHMSLLTWVRAGLTFWPASYGISLVITLLSGLIPWSVDPVNVMSICAVVVGARAGKILCDLVEEAGKPGPAPYRAIELKPSDLDLQSEEKGLRWGRLKGTYRDRPPKLPMSITDTAIVAARPADTGTGILLYLLALVGFFVMLWLALTFGMQNQGSAQATGPAPAPSPAVVVPAPTAQLPLPEPTTTSGPLAQIAADMKVGEGLLERGTKHMEQGEDATGKAELQTAIQMFDHALAIYSAYAPPYYDRAQAYAALGQPAQAAADLNRVLTLTEDPLLKQKALARLSELGGSGK